MFPIFFVRAQAPPMRDDLRRIVDAWQPDVVVHEPNEIAAAPVARARQIPHVVVGYGAPQPLDKWAAAAEPLEELWAAEGLCLTGPDWTSWIYDDLYLHPFPPSFGALPTFDTVRRLRPVGFDGTVDVVVPDWLDELGGRRSLIYVTFGTEFPGIAPIGVVAEALAGIDADVVVTVGRTLDPDSFAPAPPNVRIVQYVPQRAVLARASAMVSHAGSGALLGAAAHGVPHLCMPIGADQFVNADAVAAAGCGIAIEPEEVRVEAVRRGAERLLVEGSLHARARAVADEVAAMPSPEDVVPIIEELAVRSAARAPRENV